MQGAAVFCFGSVLQLHSHAVLAGVVGSRHRKHGSHYFIPEGREPDMTFHWLTGACDILMGQHHQKDRMKYISFRSVFSYKQMHVLEDTLMPLLSEMSSLMTPDAQAEAFVLSPARTTWLRY